MDECIKETLKTSEFLSQTSAQNIISDFIKNNLWLTVKPSIWSENSFNTSRKRLLDAFVKDMNSFSKTNNSIKTEAVRIASFNVHFWQDPYYDKRGENNLKNILFDIKKIDADILGLQEALLPSSGRRVISTDGWEKGEFYSDFEDMKYTSKMQCQASTTHCGQNTMFGNVLFGKLNFIEKGSLDLEKFQQGRCGVYAVAKIFGKNVHICCVHLDVFDESGSVRVKQIRQVLSYLDKNCQGEPVILMGDFNSCKYEDYTDDEREWLSLNNNGNEIDYKVPKIVEQHGYTDVFSMNGKFKYSVWSARRVDYIYVKNFPLNFQLDPKIYYTASSDHIPVILDISEKKLVIVQSIVPNIDFAFWARSNNQVKEFLRNFVLPAEEYKKNKKIFEITGYENSTRDLQALSKQDVLNASANFKVFQGKPGAKDIVIYDIYNYDVHRYLPKDEMHDIADRYPNELFVLYTRRAEPYCAFWAKNIKEVNQYLKNNVMKIVTEFLRKNNPNANPDLSDSKKLYDELFEDIENVDFRIVGGFDFAVPGIGGLYDVGAIPLDNTAIKIIDIDSNFYYDDEGENENENEDAPNSYFTEVKEIGWEIGAKVIGPYDPNSFKEIAGVREVKTEFPSPKSGQVCNSLEIYTTSSVDALGVIAKLKELKIDKNERKLPAFMAEVPNHKGIYISMIGDNTPNLRSKEEDFIRLLCNGENNYKYRDQISPLMMSPQINSILTEPLNSAEKRINLGNVTGLFRELLFTHNTNISSALRMFSGEYKNIRYCEQIDGKSSIIGRGAQFRWGLDSQYGEIKFIMKRHFWKAYKLGVSEKNRVKKFAKHVVFRDFWGDVEFSDGEELKNILLTQALNYNFRKKEKSNSGFCDDQYDRTNFSWCNIQIHIGENVSFFDIDAVLIPSFVWKMKVGFNDMEIGDFLDNVNSSLTIGQNFEPNPFYNKLIKIDCDKPSDYYAVLITPPAGGKEYEELFANPEINKDVLEAIKNGAYRDGTYAGNSSSIAVNHEIFLMEQKEFMKRLLYSE